MENSSFVAFSNQTEGLIFDDMSHPKYPIKYYNVINGRGAQIKNNCSYFGYVYSGIVMLEYVGRPATFLMDGMYFNSVGDFTVNGIGCDSKMVLIEVYHEAEEYQKTKFKSLYAVGGPLENTGRLKYIDGCTDTLLIPPVKMGDPCLNHLHFPVNIDQTQHTHPSHRIGVVTDGHGRCLTPFGDMPLTKGMIFVIKEWDGVTFSEGLDGKMYPNGQHAFETRESTMDVVAFHPDSDFGATDVNHPMINRTIVGDISANQIKDIQTK
jgi:hypothetical protein